MSKFLLVIMILSLITGCANPDKVTHTDTTLNTSKIITNQSCLTTIYIDNSIPYLTALDTQELIPALDFTKFPNKLTQLETNNIFGTSIETGQLVVDSKYFSDINKVDAIQIEEAQIIGQVTQYHLENSTPREIIISLIETQVIQTYWHLGATICLQSEDNTDNTYTAFFTASHEFCTNKCQSKEYSFALFLDKNTGEIRIESY